YWFVDARATLPGGIPVVPPLTINGIGGGAYYHVKKNGDDAMTIGKTTFPNYIPDEKTGLGLRAAVMFNAVSNEVLNGEASLEIAFNNSGGLNYIGLFGYAKFLGKLPFEEDLNHINNTFNTINRENAKASSSLETDKQNNPTQAASKILPMPSQAQSGLTACLGIQYDFKQSSFHANFDVYVNVIGGLIKGVGANNRAGGAVIHIAPGEWYVHMGTPNNRIGLQMGIGSINVKTESYFMTGSSIPGSPPPPQQVADILGVSMHELDYMRDLNALGDGRGFAFGSSLSVNTGDITFLILYANFQAGLGFDIMLKEYKDRYCKGSSSPMGINGWYANGQAYAYLQGELGVKVRLWFIKARIPIIKGAAAALLQAKLPNPSWFRGYLGVN
nr:hypothetical protein [Chitinophagaceae bacterium]